MLKIAMSRPERADELTLAQRMLGGGEAPEARLESGAVRCVVPFEEFRVLRESLRDML